MSGAYLKPEDAEGRLSASSSPVARTPSHNTPGAFPTDDGSDDAGSHVVGLSAPQSLSVALRARKDEYIRKRTIKIKVGTWNTASISGTEKDLGDWFVKGKGVKGLFQDLETLAKESSQNLSQDAAIESVHDQEARMTAKHATLPKNDVSALPHGRDIDLYVLGLQEVVDVASVTEAMKPYTDPNPGKKWKAALRHALPEGYERIANMQLLGLLILVYASSELAPSISNVSCTSVGTGLLGYMGNKGAVSVRIVLSETTRLCFVNCHLAAGADKAALERRLWDTAQIVSRTKFASVRIEGEEEGQEEKIGDEDFAFWFGDLNYRLDDIPGEDVRRLLLLHTRNEYDVSNKSKRRIDTELGYMDADGVDAVAASYPDDLEGPERPATESTADPPLDPKSDPTSLITTIQSLMVHDQLRSQQRQRTAFHEGWREGEINFLPTYKYDVGSVGMFDSGEKKRSPSWCDRILFRTRADRLKYEEKAKLEAEARKRDEDMKKKGLDKDADEQSVLFDYDPDEDGLVYGEEYDSAEDDMHDAELVETHEGCGDDELDLEHYISHQRVLSSDHKPLDAIFSLTYDAVIPQLKTKVHQEVVKALDKAENENRPAITMVVDNHEMTTDLKGGALAESELSSVHFGSMRYNLPTTRAVTIANTGQLDAKFRFVGKGENGDATDAQIAPSWLTISSDGAQPSSTREYALSPGDTQSIELTATVSDPDLVRELNNYSTRLEDVLILRVSEGRDHFLPVKADKWLPSCFYRTLDELVVAPAGGVRSIPRSRTNRDGTGSTGVKSSPTSTHHSAPKELFVLTEAIPTCVERSMAEWDMLHPDTTPPWTLHEGNWPFDPSSWTLQEGEERDHSLGNIRECLDTATPLKSADPDEPSIVHLETLCETLTSFLKSLRDGIITAPMWATIEPQLVAREKDKTASLDSEDVQALTMEPLSCAPVHSVSMTFLAFMLVNIMKQITPVAKEQLKSPTSSRRSITSSLASESESDAPLTTTPSTDSASKRFFANIPIRRRRAGTASSNSEALPAEASPALERRKNLLRNYAALFAPLIIRSAADDTVKGKEKKLRDERKQRVLEAFLENSQL